MSNLTSVQKDILAHCADDYTDLAEVVSIITRAGLEFRHLSTNELQDMVLGIIKDLLEAKLIQAGDVDFKSNQLQPWPGTTREIMGRIRQEWNAHMREGCLWPDPWETVIFSSTVEGDRALAEGQPRNALQEPEGGKEK